MNATQIFPPSLFRVAHAGLGRLKQSGKPRGKLGTLHGILKGMDVNTTPKSCHSSVKPPNVLVQTEIKEKFSEWKQLLSQILCKDRYTIYQLPLSNLKSMPWKDNCRLLLIDQSSHLSDTDLNVVMDYISNHGKVLSLVPLNRDIVINDETYDSKVTMEEKNSQLSYIATLSWWNPTIKTTLQAIGPLSALKINDEYRRIFVEEMSNKNKVVWSELVDNVVLSRLDFLTHYNCDDSRHSAVMVMQNIMEHFKLDCKQSYDTSQDDLLTPAVMFGDDQDVRRCFEKFKDVMENNVIKGTSHTIEFLKKSSLDKRKPSSDYLPVVLSGHCSKFDYKVFLMNLTTQYLGKVLLYSDAVESTQDIFERNNNFSMHAPHGLVITARQQTKGQGRGGNVWLSPLGCMMFSVVVTIPIQSCLGQRFPFLQHIAGVAVAMSVRDYEGYKDIPICLKWPNDIYYGSSAKIGGILVKSTCYKDQFRAVVGIGVNVSNERPTICINHLIAEYNSKHDQKLKALTIEELMGKILSRFEYLIDIFQNEGPEAFCHYYYKYWIHKDQKVYLESEKGEEVTVCGLDDYGFLQVKQGNGSVISLQPDGNSFDMMRNLILSK